MNEENTATSPWGEHRLQVPLTQMNVRIYAIHTSGPVPAEASVNLNGCSTIRGLKAIDMGNGLFISVPGYRTGSGYQGARFPNEREFCQQFRQAVLDAYEQVLYQLPQRRQEH